MDWLFPSSKIIFKRADNFLLEKPLKKRTYYLKEDKLDKIRDLEDKEHSFIIKDYLFKKETISNNHKFSDNDYILIFLEDITLEDNTYIEHFKNNKKKLILPGDGMFVIDKEETAIWRGRSKRVFVGNKNISIS